MARNGSIHAQGRRLRLDGASRVDLRRRRHAARRRLPITGAGPPEGPHVQGVSTHLEHARLASSPMTEAVQGRRWRSPVATTSPNNGSSAANHHRGRPAWSERARLSNTDGHRDSRQLFAYDGRARWRVFVATDGPNTAAPTDTHHDLRGEPRPPRPRTSSSSSSTRRPARRPAPPPAPRPRPAPRRRPASCRRVRPPRPRRRRPTDNDGCDRFASASLVGSFRPFAWLSSAAAVVVVGTTSWTWVDELDDEELDDDEEAGRGRGSWRRSWTNELDDELARTRSSSWRGGRVRPADRGGRRRCRRVARPTPRTRRHRSRRRSEEVALTLCRRC